MGGYKPGEPAQPFQLALPIPMLEVRAASPAVPQRLRVPQHHPARTPTGDAQKKAETDARHRASHRKYTTCPTLAGRAFSKNLRGRRPPGPAALKGALSRLVWVPGGLRPLWPAQRAGHSPRSPRQTGGASTAGPMSNTYSNARSARGQPGRPPTIKGAAAPPRAHANRRRSEKG